MDRGAVSGGHRRREFHVQQQGGRASVAERLPKVGKTEDRVGPQGQAGPAGPGGDPERQEILARLREDDYPVIDLTDNEVAKLHIRHMVGGRAAGVEHEVVYRFEFPERPGALLKFLTSMGQHWNISLFHYRNHGAAYGRVLVGMQVPPADRRRLEVFLKELGYPCTEETDNPVYSLFLR